MLDTLASWHWLILAVLLVIGEILGAAGFLLGAALAALLVSGLMALDLIKDWQAQLLWFAVLAVVFSAAWYVIYRRMKGKTDAPDLNDRAGQLVGRQFVLEQSLPGGQGRVQIGDTFWRVQVAPRFADQSNVDQLQPGTTMRVAAAQRQVLIIEPVA